MAMTTVAGTGILELILENKVTNAVLAALGDGIVGSSTAGNLYISLHTADPGAGGDQTTNEVAYTGYARVAISRADAQWTIAAAAGENVNAVTFPQCTGGSATATHFAIGTAASGAGQLVARGALSSSLAISNLITPSFAAGVLDATVPTTL